MAKKLKAVKDKKKGKAPAAERPRRPEQERLLDDMPKSKPLDKLCKRIHDARVNKNEAISEEQQAMPDVLRHMKAGEYVTYKAHGVLLVYTQGNEKVSAKLVDDDGGDAEPVPERASGPTAEQVDAVDALND